MINKVDVLLFTLTAAFITLFFVLANTPSSSIEEITATDVSQEPSK